MWATFLANENHDGHEKSLFNLLDVHDDVSFDENTKILPAPLFLINKKNIFKSDIY